MSDTVHHGVYGDACINTGQFDAGECHLCTIRRQEKEIKRLRSELLAAERIEYNDWTPSKGGRLG